MSSYNNHGEAGQHAAESTKAAFKHFGDATESIRQNINSYADNIVPGGHKSTSHNTRETTSPNTHDTTPLNDHSTRTHAYQHESTGIHPDAKRAGDAIVKGAGAAGGKIEGFLEKHHHKKY